MDKDKFWSNLNEFVKAYPWQIATLTIAVIAVLVNMKSSRDFIKALEVKKFRR